MANTDTFFAQTNVQTNNTLVTPVTLVAAGTTQAGATATGDVGMINVTTTPLNSGIVLAPSAAGKEVVVVNNGANAVLIYPNGTEKINALAAGAGFSAAASSVTILYCFAAGQWYTK